MSATRQSVEGHVTGDTKTKQPNRMKLGLAQRGAAASGALYDHVIADVVLLLEEIAPLERLGSHELTLDRELLAELRKKYKQPLNVVDPTL